jgi:predicted HTH domain antitoxin
VTGSWFYGKGCTIQTFSVFLCKICIMQLVIPDNVIQAANLSERNFRIELACWMYQKEFFTLGQGANFSNLSQLEFMKELGNRGIEWNFSVDDLRDDLKNLESLRNKK